MTLNELIDRVPSEWKDAPIAIGGFEVKAAVAFELVEDDDGRRCLVLDSELRDGKGKIAKKVLVR